MHIVLCYNNFVTAHALLRIILGIKKQNNNRASDQLNRCSKFKRNHKMPLRSVSLTIWKFNKTIN